jgi:hypothetical protein
MAGFYRSGYTDKAGNKKVMVVTQFEATDCRRCFPSWDEPNLKARFNITLNIELTKLFCGAGDLTLTLSLSVYSTLLGEVLLKLAIRAELTASGKLNNTLNKRTSKRASACIAQDVLTNLNIGIIDPVFHDVVGDTGRGFLRAFSSTSACDSAKTALHNLIECRGL